MELTLATEEDSIKTIFSRFQAHRLEEIYDNESMRDMNEVLTHVFNSPEWKDSDFYQPRKAFISHIRNIGATPNDHRRVFRALCDAANSHGVLEYLHMVGRKERVFLKDHAPLISIGELANQVRDKGAKIGPVIHFLCRAVAVDGISDPRTLWRTTTKAFDQNAKFKERFQEGMQSLVRRFDAHLVDPAKKGEENAQWVNKFFTTTDPKVQCISASVLAGLLAKGDLTRQSIMDQCMDFSSRMRLVNHLSFDSNDFGIQRIKRSHEMKKPSFRIDSEISP